VKKYDKAIARVTKATVVGAVSGSPLAGLAALAPDLAVDLASKILDVRREQTSRRLVDSAFGWTKWPPAST
jgi:hypothetical protein